MAQTILAGLAGIPIFILQYHRIIYETGAMAGIRTVGVVGAGRMGSEIAFVAALAGFQVFLTDSNPDAISSALDRLAALYDKGAKRGLYPVEQKALILSSIQPQQDLDGLRACEIVTEAVFEDERSKAAVLCQLDRVCKAECIFATNTSTIPISVLSSHLGELRQTRFVGMHYFSPVSRMMLVEIICGIRTSPQTEQAAVTFARSLGKTPISIKDVPGFAVNRLLHVFMIEAVRLVEEGVASPEDIDTACRLGLGHPMGPFELKDATTSSLCLQAQEIMYEAYGERFRPRPLLKQRVRAGFVGGRSSKGWRK
jgi:3-hydroxybutyryl-CoA dehydrogenase